jgi:AcrR family transcriptional regulator
MSSSKREDLVQNALRAFYAGGFNAIGMDRLAKETGVSKTSIYKHFRTKDDLILATLRLRDEQFRNWLVRRVEALTTEPAEQLGAIFDALGEWFLEPGYQGCMFVKASSEFQDRANAIHIASAEHKRLIHKFFFELATAADASDPDALAQQLLLLKEGAIVMAHLDDPAKIANSARQTADVLIEKALQPD